MREHEEDIERQSNRRKQSFRSEVVRQLLYGDAILNEVEMYSALGVERDPIVERMMNEELENIELFEELNPGLNLFADKLPVGEEVDGEIPIGIVMYTGAVYGLSLSELVTGIGIYGIPKTGKTNLVYCIASFLNLLNRMYR